MNAGVLAVTIDIGTHITWKVFGQTVNVDTVLSTLVAGAIVLGIGFYLRAKATWGVPGRLQLAVETILNAVDGEVSSTMGEAGRPSSPSPSRCAPAILIANWLELIPTGHSPQYLPPPRGGPQFHRRARAVRHRSRPRTWIRKQGLRRYLGHYLKPFKLMLPLNVIEEVIKPFTLAFDSSATSSPEGCSSSSPSTCSRPN